MTWSAKWRIASPIICGICSLIIMIIGFICLGTDKYGRCGNRSGAISYVIIGGITFVIHCVLGVVVMWNLVRASRRLCRN